MVTGRVIGVQRGRAGSDHEYMFDPKGMREIPAAKSVLGPDFEGEKVVHEWVGNWAGQRFTFGAKTGSKYAFNTCFEH